SGAAGRKSYGTDILRIRKRLPYMRGGEAGSLLSMGYASSGEGGRGEAFVNFFWEVNKPLSAMQVIDNEC
ncbi:MAG: hypothetical protein K2F93_00545, partial [Muribaculaceae bacterium]|nr:hypothetical protein [Muribaculaceae bacterium]